LKETIKTRKERRREQEKKLESEAKDVFYPPWDALKIEDREDAPAIILTIRTSDGQVVRRVSGPATAGLHRRTWDLRWADYRPLVGTPSSDDDDQRPFAARSGPLALPGRFTVSLDKRDDQGIVELVPPAPFDVEPLNFAMLAPPDRAAVLAFARQTGELQRAALGTLEALSDGLRQLTTIKQIVEHTPSVPSKLRQDARGLELKLLDLRERFTGDPTRARRNEPAVAGLIDRIETIIAGHWATTSAATGSHRRNYEIAASEFEAALASLRPLLEHDLPALHDALEAAGAPWTPGRKLPRWKR
jgi:hypothetical protein